MSLGCSLDVRLMLFVICLFVDGGVVRFCYGLAHGLATDDAACRERRGKCDKEELKV